MKASVMVKSYNNAATLGGALDSILQQRTTFPFEIVVSDDGSTDGSRELARDYALRHPERIRLILRETNLGMTPNTRATLLACRGKYVGWLDDDDYWCDPDKLQVQVDFLEANPGFSACATGVIWIDPSGRKAEDLGDGDITHLPDILRKCNISTGAIVYRRDCLVFPPNYDDLPVDDWPLHILAAQRGPIGRIRRLMTVYRHDENGGSSRWRFPDGGDRRVAFQEERLCVLESVAPLLPRPAIRYALADHYLRLLKLHLENSDLANAALALIRALRSAPLGLGHHLALALRPTF